MPPEFDVRLLYIPNKEFSVKSFLNEGLNFDNYRHGGCKTNESVMRLKNLLPAICKGRGCYELHASISDSFNRIPCIANIQHFSEMKDTIKFGIRVNWYKDEDEDANEDEDEDDQSDFPLTGYKLYGDSWSLANFEAWHDDLDDSVSKFLIAYLVERRVGRDAASSTITVDEWTEFDTHANKMALQHAVNSGPYARMEPFFTLRQIKRFFAYDGKKESRTKTLVFSVCYSMTLHAGSLEIKHFVQNEVSCQLDAGTQRRLRAGWHAELENSYASLSDPFAFIAGPRFWDNPVVSRILGDKTRGTGPHIFSERVDELNGGESDFVRVQVSKRCERILAVPWADIASGLRILDVRNIPEEGLDERIYRKLTHSMTYKAGYNQGSKDILASITIILTCKKCKQPFMEEENPLRYRLSSQYTCTVCEGKHRESDLERMMVWKLKEKDTGKRLREAEAEAASEAESEAEQINKSNNSSNSSSSNSSSSNSSSSNSSSSNSSSRRNSVTGAAVAAVHSTGKKSESDAAAALNSSRTTPPPPSLQMGVDSSSVTNGNGDGPEKTNVAGARIPCKTCTKEQKKKCICGLCLHIMDPEKRAAKQKEWEAENKNLTPEKSDSDSDSGDNSSEEEEEDETCDPCTKMQKKKCICGRFLNIKNLVKRAAMCKKWRADKKKKRKANKISL